MIIDTDINYKFYYRRIVNDDDKPLTSFTI